MLLHVKEISKSSIRNIVIYVQDTDEFLIGTVASDQINVNLLICIGTKNKAPVIIRRHRSSLNEEWLVGSDS